jgi:3-oxoacyl-[acyl-carrier-protein] synthase-3
MERTERRKIKIVGQGVYLPEKVLTNADLEKIVDTTDEWIFSRTGIRERRIGREDQATSDLGIEAAGNALRSAGLEIGDIDLILVATNTSDTIFPSTACYIQRGLKGGPVPALDISAGCSGALFGMIVAESFILSGTAKRILLVAPEMLSRVTNWEDRSTCVLFGDAAGAFVLEESHDGSGMLSHYWGADGNLADLLSIPAGGSRIPASERTVAEKLHCLQMKGNEVFKHAVKRMGEAALEALKRAGVAKEDIAWLIPHQANIRIIEATGDRLKLPREKVFVNVHKYGNCSVATIPLGLEELVREGKVKKGDVIVMDAFGAGFTWAAIVYRW